MKLNRSYLFFIFIGFIFLYACTNSAVSNSPTALPISSTETITSTPIPPTATTSFSTTIEPTSTEWLPYNPNLSDTGCSEFNATLPVTGTENLSQTDIAQNLFEIYLGHFKSPKLGGRCRLEDFTVETVQEDKRMNFLANEQKVDYISTVQYSVQIPEVPSNWVAGNGELAPNGWIIHKFLIIGITKTNDQYVLKLIGTGP